MEIERFCETVEHNQTKRWIAPVGKFPTPAGDGRFGGPARDGYHGRYDWARPFVSEKSIGNFKRSKVYPNNHLTEKPCPLNLDVALTR